MKTKTPALGATKMPRSIAAFLCFVEVMPAIFVISSYVAENADLCARLTARYGDFLPSVLETMDISFFSEKKDRPELTAHDYIEEYIKEGKDISDIQYYIEENQEAGKTEVAEAMKPLLIRLQDPKAQT